MLRLASVSIVFLTAYLLFFPTFATYMHSKPFTEKLGYVPSPDISRALAVDHKQLAATLLTLKTIMYVGRILEQQENKIQIPTDLFAMARLLRSSNSLDPYNLDTYYFAQATYIDTRRGAVFVNELLTRGMKYRTWDFTLPFYAGFNAAFILKDYKIAAEFMQKAGVISGDPLYSTLAARFFNSAGETDLAIAFMDNMEKGASDEKIRRLYHARKQNLLSIKQIELAVAEFHRRFGKLPEKPEYLVTAGILKQLPQAPAGGIYIITKDGRVENTPSQKHLKDN